MPNQLLALKWYPLLFDPSAKTDFARTICFWFAIAIALLFSLFAIILKDEKRKRFLKISVPIIIALSVAIGGFFLISSFIEDEIVAILFYPLLVFVIAIASFAILLYLKCKKPIIISGLIVTACAFIAVLVCMGIYFTSGQSEDYNGLSITSTENIMLYLLSAVTVLIIALIVLFFGKNEKKNFDSKSIAYAATCIAMSFALSYIRIVKLPQGGSITLCSLLPLMIYSYMFGVRKGVFAGLIYGVLQAIQDPWIVHPMQFLLDYPIAFASIGIAGFIGKIKQIDKIPQLSFSLGAIIASLFRFISHLFSGVFAFSEYAYSSSGEPMNAWIYSISYNSFVFIDIAICIIVGIILFSSKNFVKQLKKYNEQSI